MRYRLHRLLSRPVGSAQVEQLDRGPTKFDADLHVAYLKGPITFTRLNDAVLVQGQIQTELTVQCVRSLEDFGLCLDVPLNDILFALPGSPADEPDRQISSEGWIDLTETLREEIIMNIPINPIHPKYIGIDRSKGSQDVDPAAVLSDLDEDRDWLTVKWNNVQTANPTRSEDPRNDSV
jgi:uncharacterized metal-binding protein YceD (DUF177 family)